MVLKQGRGGREKGAPCPGGSSALVDSEGRPEPVWGPWGPGWGHWDRGLVIVQCQGLWRGRAGCRARPSRLYLRELETPEKWPGTLAPLFGTPRQPS